MQFHNLELGVVGGAKWRPVFLQERYLCSNRLLRLALDVSIAASVRLIVL